MLKLSYKEIFEEKRVFLKIHWYILWKDIIKRLNSIERREYYEDRPCWQMTLEDYEDQSVLCWNTLNLFCFYRQCRRIEIQGLVAVDCSNEEFIRILITLILFFSKMPYQLHNCHVMLNCSWWSNLQLWTTSAKKVSVSLLNWIRIENLRLGSKFVSLLFVNYYGFHRLTLVAEFCHNFLDGSIIYDRLCYFMTKVLEF